MTGVRTILRIAVALGALFAARDALASAPCAVVLRETAVVAPGEPVLLRDVAELTGDYARRHAELVVASATERERRTHIDVTLASVLKALAGVKFNQGLATVQGGVCRVRAPHEPKAEESNTAPSIAAPSLGAGPTVRDRITSILSSHLRTAPVDLQLEIDPAESALLDTPIADRRIEVTPEAAPESPRIPVRVRVYDAGGIAIDRSLRVDVQVRRLCVIAKAPIRKGQVIEESTIALEPVWVSPAVQPLSDLAGLVGQKSQARLEPGGVVTADCVKAPAVVRRNELVQVRCLSGGIILTARARSMADAAEGEFVALKLEGAERTFKGRVIGPASVLVDLDRQDGPPDAAVAPGLLKGASGMPRSKR